MLKNLMTKKVGLILVVFAVVGLLYSAKVFSCQKTDCVLKKVSLFQANNINIDLKIASPQKTLNRYSPAVKNVVEELQGRAGKQGQFLNWIEVLPQGQLDNIDKIYEMADAVRNNGDFKSLAVIGIGGSRHTNEAIVKLFNLDEDVHFYSGIDNISFERFMEKIDPKETLFLIVSKSGRTLETLTGYEKSRAILEELVGKEEAKKHFVAITGEDPAKSNLRKIVNNGDILISGVVHNDVGGRFSILDDASLFTLAYQGLSKDDMKSLLKASLKAQKEYLNPDINKNKAAQQAVFNVEAKKNGKILQFVQMFGNYFEGAQFWEKQLKNESIKDKFYTDTNIAPAYLHYNAESDLAPGNNYSAYTMVNVKPGDDKKLDAVVTGVVKAYTAQHPVSHIQLDNLTPETIAKYIELKHFETIYTGMLLRPQDAPAPEVLPEVLQPNVEKYKKEVKKLI